MALYLLDTPGDLLCLCSYKTYHTQELHGYAFATWDYLTQWQEIEPCRLGAGTGEWSELIFFFHHSSQSTKWYQMITLYSVHTPVLKSGHIPLSYLFC